MIYIVDTHAWIEYFIGSKQGFALKRMFNEKNHKFITLECCLAEIMGYCLKNNTSFDKLYNAIKRNSFILPVLTNLWIEAAKIRYEIRKRIKNFGLIDSILVAKQNELKCRIISGDSHFKNMKNIIYIGEK